MKPASCVAGCCRFVFLSLCSGMFLSDQISCIHRLLVDTNVWKCVNLCYRIRLWLFFFSFFSLFCCLTKMPQSRRKSKTAKEMWNGIVFFLSYVQKKQLAFFRVFQVLSIENYEFLADQNWRQSRWEYQRNNNNNDSSSTQQITDTSFVSSLLSYYERAHNTNDSWEHRFFPLSRSFRLPIFFSCLDSAHIAARSSSEFLSPKQKT